jgi:hypothetical protein
MMAFDLQNALEDIRRLPLWHVRRHQCRDVRLWVREKQRAHIYKLKQIHCPCTKCKGRFSYTLTNVRNHIIHNGRDASFRVWRRPGDKDSSNEQWEEDSRFPTRQQTQEHDSRINIQGIMVDAF